jgi:polyisoprenoid-binding protein YceI
MAGEATETLSALKAPSQAGRETAWMIDSAHSLVEFAVKHMMVSTVKGRFTNLRGMIRCPNEAMLSCTSVEVEIAATSIDTGNEMRDADLRSAAFLDVERYPAITFRSTGVERTGEDRLQIMGDLTIRGVTRAVKLDTTYNGRGTNPSGKEIAAFTARTRLNRKDFGLTWNVVLESGGVLVGDTVDILIEVEAIKQG